MTQPNAHISTFSLYLVLRSIYGALYHLVETYSVNGYKDVFLAIPKSISLTLPYFVIPIFSGFKSLWIIFLEWI